jgi:hypothetical protein
MWDHSHIVLEHEPLNCQSSMSGFTVKLTQSISILPFITIHLTEVFLQTPSYLCNTTGIQFGLWGYIYDTQLHNKLCQCQLGPTATQYMLAIQCSLTLTGKALQYYNSTAVVQLATGHNTVRLKYLFGASL